MKKGLFNVVGFLFAAGDLLLLNLAIFLSFRISYVEISEDNLTSEVYLFIFSNLAWFFLFLITNSYRRTSSTIVIQIRTMFSFVFVQFLVLISLVLFFNKEYSALQVSLIYVFFIPLIVLWKILYVRIIKNIHTRTSKKMNYVVVGMGDLADKIRREFRFHPEYGYKFLGYFGPVENTTGDFMPISSLQKFCIDSKVGEIFCVWPEISQAEIRKIIDFSLDNFIKVRLVTDSSEYSQSGIPLDRFGEIPIVDASALSIDEEANRMLKRMFDLCFSVVVFATVLIWLFPLVALLIKLNSKGPVFFKQLRAGRNNKPFECLKFRTMYVDKKEFVQATKDDPRVTSIGKILRKTSLDEFPQFINVFKGEMSIVGPRPHPIKLNDDFADKLRKLMSRHYVKPGITGLAQCMGYRGETRNLLDMKHRVTLDRFYVEHWSLLFDVRIIFQTAVGLLRGSEKAY